jgi:TctA family transporter
VFFTRPIAAAIMALVVLTLALPFLGALRARRSVVAPPPAPEKPA